MTKKLVFLLIALLLLTVGIGPTAAQDYDRSARCRYRIHHHMGSQSLVLDGGAVSRQYL